MEAQTQNQACHISPGSMEVLNRLLNKYYAGEALTEQETDVLAKIKTILES